MCEVDHTHHRQDRCGEKSDGVEPGRCRVHLLSLCGIIIDTQTSHIIYAYANKSERSYHRQEKYCFCFKRREVVWIFHQHYYIDNENRGTEGLRSVGQSWRSLNIPYKKWNTCLGRSYCGRQQRRGIAHGQQNIEHASMAK